MKKSSGITMALMGIAFVTFKLIGIVDWPWWLVTLPFWGPSAIVLTLVASIAITLVIVRILFKLNPTNENPKINSYEKSES
jgi:hypothetical protein